MKKKSFKLFILLQKTKESSLEIAKKTTEESLGTNVEVSKDTGSESEKPKEDFNKGVIFYLRGGSVVGILLWNITGKIYRARQVRKYMYYSNCQKKI